MLLSLLVLLHQASSTPSTCPNLSGRYVIQGEDGQVFISIVQTRCARIVIEWNYGSPAGPGSSTHVLALDARFHADGGWFGGGRQQTSAGFRSGKLEIVARPLKSADTSVFIWKQVLEPARGDLCTRFLDSHAKSWSAILAGRSKAPGSSGADEAAGRSEKNYASGPDKVCD